MVLPPSIAEQPAEEELSRGEAVLSFGYFRQTKRLCRQTRPHLKKCCLTTLVDGFNQCRAILYDARFSFAEQHAQA